MYSIIGVLNTAIYAVIGLSVAYPRKSMDSEGSTRIEGVGR
jgi:hypothetical protein